MIDTDLHGSSKNLVPHEDKKKNNNSNHNQTKNLTQVEDFYKYLT